MSELGNRVCEACRVGAPLVTDAEAAALHVQVPEWEILDIGGIKRLARRYRFGDFAEALAFANAVGAIAEEASHHPRLVTEWGSVEVTWWTHKIRGLHLNDFIMAARTDAIDG